MSGLAAIRCQISRTGHVNSSPATAGIFSAQLLLTESRGTVNTTAHHPATVLTHAASRCQTLACRPCHPKPCHPRHTFTSSTPHGVTRLSHHDYITFPPRRNTGRSLRRKPYLQHQLLRAATTNTPRFACFPAHTLSLESILHQSVEDQLPNQGDGEISSTASSPPFCSFIFVEQEDYTMTDILFPHLTC